MADNRRRKMSLDSAFFVDHVSVKDETLVLESNDGFYFRISSSLS